MRVASNKLKDLIQFYHQELSGLYEAAEIDALAYTAIGHYLGYTRSETLKRLNENLNQSDLLKLYDCAKALRANKPIQYILGSCWFYNLSFRVSDQVLIPRPETEELTELIIRENQAASSFLDIGTGSGCIPVSIKKSLSQARVCACDLSAGALDIARTNAAANQSEVLFFEADVLDGTHFSERVPGCFEVIVSNPPYVIEAERHTLSPHVLGQEPEMALFVQGEDAIVFYKRIIGLCDQTLENGGRLYFELNPLTAVAVYEFALGTGLFEQAVLINDLSGQSRFLRAVKKM